MKSLLQCVLVVGMLLLVGGCGGGASDADPDLVPVTGTVTWDGQPVPDGSITFVPDGGDGQAVSGKIDAGKYELKTSPSAPGARPGNYKVCITAWKTAPTMNEDGTPVEGVPLVPVKFQSPETSKLTAEVKQGGSEIPFDLKP